MGKTNDVDRVRIVVTSYWGHDCQGALRTLWGAANVCYLEVGDGFVVVDNVRLHGVACYFS